MTNGKIWQRVVFIKKTLLGSPVARVLTGCAAVIGFAASVYGLWPLMFPSQPDTAVTLVTSDARPIVLHGPATIDRTEFPLVGRTITIEGGVVDVPSGAVLLGNKIVFEEGGEIHGRQFSLIAPVLEGGRLSADGVAGTAGDASKAAPAGSGSPGGSILVVAAAIGGTVIRADGGPGGPGDNGTPGRPERPAPDGRDGSCAGFGGYRGADPGSDGAIGNPGQPGQDGALGGDGGDIVVLLSQGGPSPTASAGRGVGGAAGFGGAGGPGQLGGKGGRGCTGLGGSQPNQSDGRTGPPGAPGSNGHQGVDGHEGSVVIRHVRFADVARAWRKSHGNMPEFLNAVQSLPSD